MCRGIASRDRQIDNSDIIIRRDRETPPQDREREAVLERRRRHAALMPDRGPDASAAIYGSLYDDLASSIGVQLGSARDAVRESVQCSAVTRRTAS